MSGCEWGCYTGERILIAAIGALLTTGTTIAGMGLGTWGTGTLLGGRGSIESTFVGMAVGGALPFAALLVLGYSDADTDTMLHVLIGGLGMALIGGAIGYELSHAAWRPEVGISPDGRSAYVGASARF